MTSSDGMLRCSTGTHVQGKMGSETIGQRYMTALSTYNTALDPGGRYYWRQAMAWGVLARSFLVYKYNNIVH